MNRSKHSEVWRYSGSDRRNVMIWVLQNSMAEGEGCRASWQHKAIAPG
jgi:hypothetical protein